MTTTAELRPSTTPVDPFLFAIVGDDRNGNAVSVLSTLARLGLDPWEAATDLAALSRDEARARLDAMLARFRDVPALGQDRGAILRRLIDLLPQAGVQVGSARLSGAVNALGTGPMLTIALAVVMVALLVVQALLPGGDGN